MIMVHAYVYSRSYSFQGNSLAISTVSKMMLPEQIVAVAYWTITCITVTIMFVLELLGSC